MTFKFFNYTIHFRLGTCAIVLLSPTMMWVPRIESNKSSGLARSAFTHKAILSPQPNIFDQKSFYSQGKLNTNTPYPIHLFRASFTQVLTCHGYYLFSSTLMHWPSCKPTAPPCHFCEEAVSLFYCYLFLPQLSIQNYITPIPQLLLFQKALTAY